MPEFLQSLDESLFWALNGSWGAVGDIFFIAVTCTGYTVPAAVIGLLAFHFYGGITKKRAAMLVLSLLVGGVAVQGIKQSWPKDRPLGHFGEISAELKEKVHAPFKRPHHRTFPSGHSQTGFSVAVLLALMFRRQVGWWLLWAALLAYSRVYIGVHFPLDIIAGSAIGALGAWGVYEFGKRKGWVTPVGAEEPPPTP